LSSRRLAVIVRLSLCFSAVAAVLLTSVPAAAQESRPGRPYRGLFGPEERNAARVLAVNGQVGSGYETGVLVERRQIDEIDLNIENSSFFESESVFSLFSGGISYVDHTDRLDFNAAFQSTARDYSRFAMVSSHTGSTSVSARLGRRTTVSAFGTASYQPWGAIIYGSGASIAQQVSRRSTVSAGYSYDLADYSGLAGDYQHQQTWLRYTQGLTRNLGWHGGYSYSEARFRDQSAGARARGRGFDLGVDYNRNLSLTRRTQFGFGTGMAAVDSNVAQPVGFQGTQYSVTGAAWLNHEISRTWDAAVSYSRNVAFFESLRAPYFYDGVNAGLSGFISRRVALSASVGATYGDAGVRSGTGDPNRLVTGAASTSLTIALSRYAAIGAQYAFYVYSLGDANAFWTPYAPDMRRHVALVSLRAWAPIIERGRRGNATR